MLPQGADRCLAASGYRIRRVALSPQASVLAPPVGPANDSPEANPVPQACRTQSGPRHHACSARQLDARLSRGPDRPIQRLRTNRATPLAGSSPAPRRPSRWATRERVGIEDGGRFGANVRGDAAATSEPLLSMTMPLRRGLKPLPRNYVAKGQKWPHGNLGEKVPGVVEDVPGVVFFVQDIARKVKVEVEENDNLSVKQLAEDADVSMQTVYDFLNGDSWGTLTLIYSLERALQQSLWSRDHLSPKWDIMVRDHNASKN